MSVGDLISRLTDIASEAWCDGLGSILVEAAEEDDPRTSMVSLVDGWIGSYRGFYDQLAIGVAPAGRKLPVRVAKLSYDLTEALAVEHEAYKGGRYRYTRDTRVWLAAKGDGRGLALVAVEWDPSVPRLRLIGRQAG